MDLFIHCGAESSMVNYYEGQFTNEREGFYGYIKAFYSIL